MQNHVEIIILSFFLTIPLKYVYQLSEKTLLSVFGALETLIFKKLDIFCVCQNCGVFSLFKFGKSSNKHLYCE